MQEAALKRWKRMLNRAAKEPGWVLRDRRCCKPEFCEAFFEICEDKGLQDPGAALKYAAAAVELAREIGDPHLIHRAQGVLVHAHVCAVDHEAAERLLDDYRLSAFTCCKACSGDWLRRRADLLAESVDGRGGCEMVERTRRMLGEDLDADMGARLRFIESIAKIYRADRDGALKSAGRALLDLDLSSPRGYFLDSLAFLICFQMAGGRRRHARVAERFLADFQERLKGLRGWTDVRTRKSWTEGHVFGRLGEWRKAADRLDAARLALLESGPPHHALAATLDLCQVHARWVNDVSLRAIRRVLSICRRQRDLDRELRRGLKFLLKQVSWYPERTSFALALCRMTLTVPIPGLLAQQALPRTASLEDVSPKILAAEGAS